MQSIFGTQANMYFALDLIFWNSFFHMLRPGSSPCQVPWQYFQGACYLASSLPMKFQEAEAECVQRGGHLAHIASEKENSLVAELGGHASDRWIGYTDIQSHGTWMWSSSAKSTYSNWQRYYPKTAEGDCTAMLENGEWVNRQCSNTQEFICKKGNARSTSIDKMTSAFANHPLRRIFLGEGLHWKTFKQMAKKKKNSILWSC